MLGRAMNLDAVQRCNAFGENGLDALADVCEVSVDGSTVNISLAALELVVGAYPTVVDTAFLCFCFGVFPSERRRRPVHRKHKRRPPTAGIRE